MEFDKSRVYTALNADELKIGSKVILADNLSYLKGCVDYSDDIVTLVKIESEEVDDRFFDGNNFYNLAYLVEEPEEKKLKWTDLKVGDVITDGRHNAMITQVDTQVDKECIYNMHIYAGNRWFKDSDLTEWEKVEND